VRRRLEPDVRRKEILRAATRAFATRPFDQVQLDAIAREAGASRGLINHYFGDKRGLFIAVARGIVERIPTVLRTDLDMSVDEMVSVNTDAWLTLIEANREASLLFLGASALSVDPEFDRLQDELRDRVVERILRNHLGDAEIPPLARVTLRATTGLIERALRDWATGRGGTRAQTHALISQSVLATVRHVLPAVLAARD
jgi:AcrR family transcriptional regulator